MYTVYSTQYGLLLDTMKNHNNNQEGIKNSNKIILSLLIFTIAAAHVSCPYITLDLIALVLLTLALIPWLLPYIKEIEIHGVAKITTREIAQIKSEFKEVHHLKAEPVEAKSSVSRPTISSTGNPAKDTEFTIIKDKITDLIELAESNPDLALMGFRRELEVSIIRVANAHGIDRRKFRGMNNIVAELAERGILTVGFWNGFRGLNSVLNRVTHGEATTTTDAAISILSDADLIIYELLDATNRVNPIEGERSKE